MRRTGLEFQDQIHQMLPWSTSEGSLLRTTGLIGDTCTGATGASVCPVSLPGRRGSEGGSGRRPGAEEQQGSHPGEAGTGFKAGIKMLLILKCS